MASGRGDPLDLTGRRILISGGAGALGRVIVERLTDHGARVSVADLLTPGTGAALFGENPLVDYHTVDCADPEAVATLFDGLTALPDTVCCHAGIAEAHPIERYPLDVFDRVLAANVRGNFILAREAARRWREADVGGHLVFTTSWVADVPWPGIGPYSASKAALRSLTATFARELGRHRIRANAIAPGIVAAGMAQHQWDTEPDYRARAARAIPLGYLQPPGSVADTFLALVSPLCDYMTGSTLVVDGGASTYPMD